MTRYLLPCIAGALYTLLWMLPVNNTWMAVGFMCGAVTMLARMP